jgi:hypothetical protein
MNRSIFGGALAAFAFALAAPLAHAGDVSVGVTITGDVVPGVYGRVDLGNRPPPPIVYEQPVIIERPPPRVFVPPIYLHVPPGHAKNWRAHCAQYHACNRPVYFVKSREYDPGYRRDDRHDDHHDDHHDHDKGRGHNDHDKGHGHDKH